RRRGGAVRPAPLVDAGASWRADGQAEIAAPGGGGRGEKVAVVTQQRARVVEAAIARHPEDWHMLQKVFVADLDPERLARQQGQGWDNTRGQEADPWEAGDGHHRR